MYERTHTNTKHTQKNFFCCCINSHDYPVDWETCALLRCIATQLTIVQREITVLYLNRATILLKYFEYRDFIHAVPYRDTHLQYRY